ncbi:hypothetical protein [Thalassospira sp.]|uniref:helix-turn-helix transcriptional regulator n=1 Tax=Thalassospira sp. TaxID=1912094 RepID=UPI001B0998DF|nr:hypothetical protein [Thalassospira sp.]MBO6807545.1 hypothetical protein [Thalassospira sp.]MBO6840070.1 hypothetical protein [Thalassospira sp.]
MNQTNKPQVSLKGTEISKINFFQKKNNLSNTVGSYHDQTAWRGHYEPTKSTNDLLGKQSKFFLHPYSHRACMYCRQSTTGLSLEVEESMVARKIPKFVPDPRYWTDWQLAHHLGCSPNTMHRKIAKLDGFPKKDSDFGWDSVAIEAYLNRRSGLTLNDATNENSETEAWETLINGSDQPALR